MNFLLHVGEPLFHCIQGRRFVGVRGSHDCRITFSVGAKIFFEQSPDDGEKFVLRISSAHDIVDDNGDLKIDKFI